LAIATFAKMMVIDNLLLKNSAVTYQIALIVSLTLLVTIIVAKLVGCALPILAKRVGFDPAVMASPFITTIVDALSLLIYFQIAASLIAGL
jgi:magnesium transporter